MPEEVIRAWSQETAQNSAWVESLGARVATHGDYRPEFPEMPGSESYGGYIGVDGELGNSRLFKTLSAAVREREIEVLLDTPGRELLRDASGAIAGVEALSGASEGGTPLRVRARRGVVLATGGFENNPEMVRDYLRLPDSPVWGSPAGTGDGIRMAQQVGADLWHMDNMATQFRLPRGGLRERLLRLVRLRARIHLHRQGRPPADGRVPPGRPRPRQVQRRLRALSGRARCT